MADTAAFSTETTTSHHDRFSAQGLLRLQSVVLNDTRFLELLIDHENSSDMLLRNVAISANYTALQLDRTIYFFGVPPDIHHVTSTCGLNFINLHGVRI
jgi:hypothetical protein